MDSIFPLLDTDIQDYQDSNNVDTDLPIPTEYQWDFDNNCLKLVNGKAAIVTGSEAIKTWAYLALNIARNTYNIYSEDYGNEIESLIGQGLSGDATKIELQRILEECLLVNPYINGVSNLETSQKDDLLTATFTISTDYGEVDMNV